ncbi:MAG: hypothetical protein RL693_656 [Verrucomicrobiota bacterium]|jgi:hypothetical protein
MSTQKLCLIIAALLTVVALLILTAILLNRHLQNQAPRRSLQNESSATAPPARVEKQEKPLTGEIILQHYADPARPPEEDLTGMAHALDNFALLVKGDTPVPLGANEEIARALKGKNRVQMRFLPETSPAFNPAGQIIDRWGTPLFFHANDRTRLDIRSAGPDRVMWTADDLHRKHDGSFLRGETLLSPSLFEATTTAPIKP